MHVASSGVVVVFIYQITSVFNAISKLHKIAAEIHPDTGAWTLASWFWTLFATWGWKLLTVLCIIFAILLVCCLCIQCGPMLCSICITACTPAKRDIVKMNAQRMLAKEIDNMMQIDVQDVYLDYSRS